MSHASETKMRHRWKRTSSWGGATKAADKALYFLLGQLVTTRLQPYPDTSNQVQFMTNGLDRGLQHARESYFSDGTKETVLI